jgi:hypothetical protein
MHICKYVVSCLPVDVFVVLTHRVGPRIIGLRTKYWKRPCRATQKATLLEVVDGCALLALLSLYELIRKRTDTHVAFTREFT